jgi:hypothetical protein
MVHPSACLSPQVQN